jgi:hypothetical protein
VSTNFTICTLTKDKKLQLLGSLSSLDSRVELFCNKCSSDSSKCVKCKTQKTQDKIEIMADSGASNCFTHTQSDLSEFEVLDDNELVVRTASKTNSLKLKEKERGLSHTRLLTEERNDLLQVVCTLSTICQA